MPPRSNSIAQAGAIGALVAIVCAGAAMAQTAPPPAVSVRPTEVNAKAWGLSANIESRAPDLDLR
jgi:hypothetical protein